MDLILIILQTVVESENEVEILHLVQPEANSRYALRTRKVRNIRRNLRPRNAVEQLSDEDEEEDGYASSSASDNSDEESSSEDEDDREKFETQFDKR